MPDTIKYVVRVISVEAFGEPTIYKVVARVVGSKSLVTMTLPVAPRFVAGEEVTISIG